MSTTLAAFENMGTSRARKVYDANNPVIPAGDLSALPSSTQTAGGDDLAQIPRSFSGTVDDYLSLPAGKSAGLRDFELLGEGETRDNRPDFFQGRPGQPRPKSYTGSAEGLNNMSDEDIKSLQSVDVTGTPPAPRRATNFSKDQTLAIEQAGAKTSQALNQRREHVQTLTGAKRQLDTTMKQLTEQRKMLGGDSARRRLTAFVKNGVGETVEMQRVQDVLAKQQRGEALSRRETSLISTYNSALQTLQDLDQTDHAIANIPLQAAAIDRQLRDLVSLPVPSPEDTRQALEAKFTQVNDRRADALTAKNTAATERDIAKAETRQHREITDLRLRRTELKSDIAQAEKKAKPYDDETSKESAAIQNEAKQEAVDKGLLIDVKGKLQPKDAAAGKQYAALIQKKVKAARDKALSGVDVAGASKELADVETQLKDARQKSASPPASNAAADQDVQSLMRKYGVSEAMARRALQQAE